MPAHVLFFDQARKYKAYVFSIFPILISRRHIFLLDWKYYFDFIYNYETSDVVYTFALFVIIIVQSFVCARFHLYYTVKFKHSDLKI